MTREESGIPTGLTAVIKYGTVVLTWDVGHDHCSGGDRSIPPPDTWRIYRDGILEAELASGVVALAFWDGFWLAHGHGHGFVDTTMSPGEHRYEVAAVVGTREIKSNPTYVVVPSASDPSPDSLPDELPWQRREELMATLPDRVAQVTPELVVVALAAEEKVYDSTTSMLVNFRLRDAVVALLEKLDGGT